MSLHDVCVLFIGIVLVILFLSIPIILFRHCYYYEDNSILVSIIKSIIITLIIGFFIFCIAYLKTES